MIYRVTGELRVLKGWLKRSRYRKGTDYVTFLKLEASEARSESTDPRSQKNLSYTWRWFRGFVDVLEKTYALEQIFGVENPRCSSRSLSLNASSMAICFSTPFFRFSYPTKSESTFE
ncbi:hypothetical protein L596_014496 [Steinernema carpocapsae]|uniref:Uncharacterized protein n=1 Tax=Steinernema carpocapsae TaxID=34508 RepID=A0A4U5NCW3_STECR|nr:hypothetical protein L596_014496 [Steinernema carpocapsae]